KGGKLIEISLAPFLIGMMMALGALEAHAEEDLPKHRGRIARIAAVAEDNRWAVLMGAPLSGEKLSGELIERFVLAKTLTNPFVQKQNALDANALRIGPDQVAPFGSPIVGVIWIQK